MDNAKNQLNNLLQEAFDNSLIPKKEFTALNHDGKGAAKFYMTFQVHKEHEHEKAPP